MEFFAFFFAKRILAFRLIYHTLLRVNHPFSNMILRSFKI